MPEELEDKITYTVQELHGIVAKINENPTFTERDLDIIREVVQDVIDNGFDQH